jgi:hypothetical protein
MEIESAVVAVLVVAELVVVELVVVVVVVNDVEVVAASCTLYLQ